LCNRRYNTKIFGVGTVKNNKLSHTLAFFFKFEVKMAIEELKRPKTPAADHIPAELIKAVGRIICCEIHKLISPT
jgi:hypothetical protein